MIVAVAGCTGKLSRLCVAALLKNPYVQIHGICRDSSKVPENFQKEPRVTIFRSDWNDVQSLRRGIAGAHVVVCGYRGCNAMMLEGQQLLIDACIMELVPRYIAADFSVDYRRLKPGEAPHLDYSIQIAAYLAQRACKIRAVHLLVGVLVESFWSSLGVWDVEIEEFEIWGTGQEVLDLTTYNTVAEYLAEIVLDKTVEGYISVVGDKKSISEIARLVHEIYRVDVPVNMLGSMNQLYSKMHKRRRTELRNDRRWASLFKMYYAFSNRASLAELHNVRFPNVKPTDMRTFLKTVSFGDINCAAFF